MVKVAIIGAGYMAREHIRAFQDVTNVVISGIYSRTISKAQLLAQEFEIKVIAENIEELFNKTRADLVVITASVSSIAAVSIKCSKFPWICLIEKPPGYNLEEAFLIRDHFIQNKARVFVALNRRHYSSTLAVLDQLKDQDSFRLIKVCDQEDMNDPVRIGHPKNVIDNWMYANSIHMVDYFSIFCRGKLLSVDPVIKWDPNNPRYVVAKLEFDSGDVGLYEAVWNAPSPWSVSVITSKVRWDMSPLEVAARQDYGSRKKVPINLNKWDDDFKPGLRMQAHLAVGIVQNSDLNLPTLDDAIQTMQMINLIYQE